jgi:hypothetical protein
VTIPLVPPHQPRTVEYHLGSSPPGRPDGGFEATLVMQPGEPPRVRLTQLAWGVGVGWYAQRTLDLDLDEAHQIAALLNRAPKLAEHSADAEPDVSGPAPRGRQPIDLASVRARKHESDRQSALCAAGRTDTALAPIADRQESAVLNERPAGS